MHRHPRTLAEAVSRSNGDPDRFAVAVDEFLDVFYSEADPARRQAMLREEPRRLGNERLDAFVGAVAEHLAMRWNLRVPRWAQDDSRDVATPWFVGRMGKALSPMLLAESPIAFRRRRIFTESEPLRRARMPAG